MRIAFIIIKVYKYFGQASISDRNYYVYSWCLPRQVAAASCPASSLGHHRQLGVLEP